VAALAADRFLSLEQRLAIPVERILNRGHEITMTEHAGVVDWPVEMGKIVLVTGRKVPGRLWKKPEHR
jgi:hypothetical protein